MNESLLAKVESLKSALEKDERVLLLNEVEERMNKDEEVMKLAYQKDMALLAFEDALKHFPESSQEVKDAQNRLYKSKLALDEHPLVIEYKQKYKAVRELYDQVNKELFFDFDSIHGGDFND